MNRSVNKSMKKSDKRKCLGATALAIVIAGGLIFSGAGSMCVRAEELTGDNSETTTPTHGTTDIWITEDMLNNTPPEDYVINEEVQMKAEKGAYNQYFLKDDVQTVHIEIDENNLNYLLQNAQEEPYVMTDSVTIGDTTLGYCGLKTKGNYTLLHSYTDNAGSDRFSFTINFGKYIKKADYGKTQDFYGCKKISFNNFFFDKSMMKEFFALQLMEEMGLPTPQHGLAKLYINGEYYGVYAMVETFDEPIMQQYLGVDDDELTSYLCKPEKTTFDYEALLEDNSPLWERDEDTYEDVQDMLPTVMEWARKLNCLSDGTDFEGNKIEVNSDNYIELLRQVLNVDEAVRYFATHSWLCQMDNMFVEQQNFGLYLDEAGVATLLPWDYDLSFGCYFPSTAENTANYDLDIMYKKDYWAPYSVNADRKVYKDYPLFYVIYQNDALMEQYHNYMKDCSKIAALGGTVTATGKVYEPGYFNSYIEKMQEAVVAAASEKTAANVYYMNQTKQPANVKKALPNLAKIIAMRSVGVLVQVEEQDTTVSGFGCDLSTLGNAIRGDYATRGNLTIVDAATGIFASAEYGGGKIAPLLTVSRMEESDERYAVIKEAVDCGAGEEIVIYSMKNSVAPTSAYTLTIPVASYYVGNTEPVKFYSYSAESGGTELSMTVEDNLYTTTTDSIACIVMVMEGGSVSEEPTDNAAVSANGDEIVASGDIDDGTDADDAKDTHNSSEMVVITIVAVAVIAVCVALFCVVVAQVRKKRKNNV